MARNMPCNRDVSVRVKKTFPTNMEKHGMERKWDIQLADNTHMVIKQTNGFHDC